MPETKSTLAVGSVAARGGGPWHKVESVIDGDAVTKCGRRMPEVTASGDELLVADVMGPDTERCKQCFP